MSNPAEQKEIIQNVLERKDSMAVLLMGFGKSMCYVLPPSKGIIFYTVISHTALFWFLVVIASIVAEHYTGNIL
jgi:ribose 5-phosphate isomerase RpiB